MVLNHHFSGYVVPNSAVINAIGNAYNNGINNKSKIPEPDRYKGHSFRIGGATSLAKRGVPSHIIQIMGRWRSECYKLYIRFTHKEITDLQYNLANLKITNKNSIFLYHNESRNHPLYKYIR